MVPLDEWNRCRGWIEAALEYSHGTHSIEDIERAIIEERAFLLAGEKSAFVCEVETHPQMRVLHIWLAGGDLAELKSADSQMDDIARNLGCTRITISGRCGWERALRGLGYRPLYYTVGKDL